MGEDTNYKKSALIERLLSIYRKILSSDWELYQEPYLNGAQPDLVALHPKHGVCLLLIEPLRLTSPELRWENLDFPTIMQETPNSVSTYKIPLPRIHMIGREVSTLYGFRFGRPLGGAISSITVGVVYPNLEIDLSSVFAHQTGNNKYDLFCLTGRQMNEVVSPEILVPQLRNETFPAIKGDAVADIRNWLAPRSVSSGCRNSFGAQQKLIDTNENNVRRRRVRGGPGSGKTEALTSRAARLTDEGKDVLFLSYNITILNELRDRFYGYVSSPQARVTFLHFHDWVRRIGAARNLEVEIKRLWSAERQRARNMVPQLVARAVDDWPLNESELFDAVIVDEAQDMSVEWLKLAARSVRPGGEFLIAADLSQDIYEIAEHWVEQDMTGLGFKGRWIELKESYRTPSFLIAFLNRFGDHYQLGDKDDRLNERISNQPQLNDRFKWEVSSDNKLGQNCVQLVQQLLVDDRRAEHGPADISMSDIVVLVDRIEIGRNVAEILHQRGISLATTFECSWHRNITDRDLKLEFSSQRADVKISTIHSYKGFGSSRLVVVVRQQSSPRHVFAALSRIKGSSLGQSLYVISANQTMNRFYKNNFQN